MSDKQTDLTCKSDDLWASVKAANQGDKTALAELRTALAGNQADALIATVGSSGGSRGAEATGRPIGRQGRRNGETGANAPEIGLGRSDCH